MDINLPVSQAVPPPNMPVVGGMAKEAETMRIPTQSEAPQATEAGQEESLSREVSQSGVSLHPTTVQISKTIQQLGVKTVGQTPVVSTTPTVSLPLSDDQIAQGLHQSITSSWRWLATWCERRLKEIHTIVRSV